MNSNTGTGSSTGVLGRMIPGYIRKTIQDIKEITGKHSDDEIYLMLKDCNMDPNETAQKLLYIDTFHEVKKKRDKRKSNVSTQSYVQPRLTSSMQQRGPRGGRGNNSSHYIPNDAGHRRQVSGRQQNGGTNHTERSTNPWMPIQHRTESDAAYHNSNSSVALANGRRSVSNGSFTHGHTSQVSADNIIDVDKGTSVVDVCRGTSVSVMNELVKSPALPAVAVKQLPNLNPGPTPAPTPTTTSIVSSGARFDGINSESGSSHLPTSMNSAPLSGVYSSASDPVLLPSLNSRNPGAVGAIKRETGSQQSSTEFIGSSSKSRLNVGQDGRNNSQADTGTANRTSQGVEKSENSEPPRASSLLNHDKSCTSLSKQDGWPSQQVNGPSNVMNSQGGLVAHGANVQSLPKPNESVLEQAISQLDMKLEKLKISTRQPVIFPDYIQVPEAFLNGLTFGSLDDALGHTQNGIKDECVDGTVLTNHDAAREPSLRDQDASSAACEGDDPAHSQMHSNAPKNFSPLEVDASSAAASNPNELKPEILPHIGGSMYPFLHTTPDYSFGYLPPMLGPHLVQVEVTEVGNSTVPSTGSSQPVGAGQNSVAVSPQLIPLLQQPYPSNYVPYNPYFPQLYVPHNAHQFLGHSGFAQHASTGNIYVPQPTAVTGVKYPVQPLYKPGNIAGNLAHFGIPSGYGSYGSSAVGYGLGATITAGSSASNEGLPEPELNETNIYSTLKQNEESQVWTSATGQDMSTLQATFFYNYPQGQQVAYSPAYSGQGPLGGMSHLTQTTGAPTTVQSLPQQSQAVAGSVEPVVPSTGTYQQPHSQINWNSKLFNRENI
ncbi:hypothetical protein ACH5RR_027743 [Cinchona calisaya]|uniref:GBF-interacting protein 1 N-terminal domain-containing protein n=1 Tax=Cinchona calisaya TaxID=153742 RepID=A0ABD2YQ10_9GENT